MPEEDTTQPTQVSFAEFLESHPPGSLVPLPDLNANTGGAWQLSRPELQLHCDSEACGGNRIFRCSDPHGFIGPDRGWLRVFMVYVCRNCGRSQKTYALLLLGTGDASGQAYKIGEHPAFGPPVPSRVISLIGPDRDLFLRGRNSENQGLGIGAFAYYRRVVENQWQRLVGEVISVAKHIGARPETLAVLEAASKENQFSRAVEQVKDAIPEVLLVRGHNPLTLLHRALSEGLHSRTEEECLSLASSIRVILTELAERIGIALKDEQELRDAVSRLLRREQ